MLIAAPLTVGGRNPTPEVYPDLLSASINPIIQGPAIGVDECSTIERATASDQILVCAEAAGFWLERDAVYFV